VGRRTEQANMDETRRTRAKAWATRNRDGLTIAVISFALAAVWSAFVARIDPIWAVAVLNGAMMLILVLQRASVSASVSRLRDVVIYELGIPWHETLYSSRQRHFVREKRILAQTVVERILPSVIDRVRPSHPDSPILIILDSGTTITPIFEEIMRHGVRSSSGMLPRDKVRLATNNVAGIDVVQRMAQEFLTEEEFTLLGGTPLGTYRATTGPTTLSTLRSQLEMHKKRSIGIVTANWLLVGQEHNMLALCARGRGHADFKKLIVEEVEYLIVVSPLGKIFCIDSVERIGQLMRGREAHRPQDEYQRVSIDRPRERTILVSTRRAIDSRSPLSALSLQLFEKDAGHRGNFTLESPIDPFLPGDDERGIDLPHLWTRKHTRELFHEVK
jgi:hypothetical protein